MVFNYKLGLKTMRNPHFTEEGDTMIWFSGTTQLCVVNMTNFGAREIQNLLPSVSELDSAIALRCVAKNQGKVILVSYLYNQEYKLAYYEAGEEASHVYVSEKFSNSKITYANFLTSNFSVKNKLYGFELPSRRSFFRR